MIAAAAQRNPTTAVVGVAGESMATSDDGTSETGGIDYETLVKDSADTDEPDESMTLTANVIGSSALLRSTVVTPLDTSNAKATATETAATTEMSTDADEQGIVTTAMTFMPSLAMENDESGSDRRPIDSSKTTADTATDEAGTGMGIAKESLGGTEGLEHPVINVEDTMTPGKEAGRDTNDYQEMIPELQDDTIKAITTSTPPAAGEMRRNDSELRHSSPVSEVPLENGTLSDLQQRIVHHSHITPRAGNSKIIPQVAVAHLILPNNDGTAAAMGTTNTRRAPFISLSSSQSLQSAASSTHGTTFNAPNLPMAPSISPHAAIRVIKGEIHNMLAIMRTDQKYVSRLRFTEEIGLDDDYGSATLHPVALALQELHESLTAAVESNKADAVLQQHQYLEPFCQAIQRRDISAAVTGTALAAIHKFVLYGFVSTTRSSGHMVRIAQALLFCTFEEGTGPGTTAGLGHAASLNPASSGLVNGVSASSALASAPMLSNNSTMVVNAPGTGAPNRRDSGFLLMALHQQNVSTTKLTMSIPYDDEQTVLKLLDVAALIVRTCLHSDAVHQVEGTTIVRLFEVCLHVSHRAESASPLLKSAATSALSQIVLQVFAGPGLPSIMEARRGILANLASLLDPISLAKSAMNDKSKSSLAIGGSSGGNPKVSLSLTASSQLVIANSLALVNIALETYREPLTPEEINILQKDVCKYLLQWSSTTHDLMLLSLSLRVIFNLFQSIRNDLKVPLEVFLTSVHLRILSSPSHTPEEREVALESILEFCQEPALIEDIFLNYDCDVACTNLYESIVGALGRAAVPAEAHIGLGTSLDESDGDQEVSSGRGDDMEGSDRGASIARASSTSDNGLSKTSTRANRPPDNDISLVSPVTHLQRLGMEGLLAVLDSIAKRCQELQRSNSSRTTDSTDTGLGGLADSDMEGRSEEGGLTGDVIDQSTLEVPPEELAERKRRKHALLKISRAFNEGPTNDTWLQLAVKEGLLESEKADDGAAEILFTAPELDKTKLGIFLSKGPDKDFPFNATMREKFVARYNFTGLTFSAALRLFLSKFRLPGEAQCIDRLMEAFSKALFRQQGEGSIFKNADAIYVLSFSTIMLNTDLHNPTIKEDRRMTREQFIRNNRGINNGEDLPAEYLGDLYDKIKEKQIEVRRELGEFMTKHGHEDFRTVWENLLTKQGEVATAFFTPAGETSTRVTGFHDKEMFLTLSKPALHAFSSIFKRTWDDALLIRALRGLQTLARVSAYFDCDNRFNDVLRILLPLGRDYISARIFGLQASNERPNGESWDEDETASQDESEHPIPYDVLSSNVAIKEIDISGSASHRGLLALDCALVLVRTYCNRVTTSWSEFVDCLCVLRDARGLPAGLADLDDFADSNGNVLPMTNFSKMSIKRLEDFYRARDKEEGANSSKGGWLRSLFQKKSSAQDDQLDDDSIAARKVGLSCLSKTLLAICEAVDVESIMQHEASRIPAAEARIKVLLDSLDAYPFKRDPVGEQHAIFCLELATRALLSQRDRAIDLFSAFLSKFEAILGNVSPEKVPAPFVIERIVVTILRCCIHLYEITDLRPQLRACLQLFVISLPRSFIRVIADRMACGLAIILRASFHLFESHTDWALMGDTLDTLAHYESSRVFVFDGIASTVEFALLQIDDANFEARDDKGCRPSLSKEACDGLSRILIRFVLGFYQNDTSLAVPAMLCLEKVYRRRVEILVEKSDTPSKDSKGRVPDQNFWQNVAVAVYSVCRSQDLKVSSDAIKCYRRLVVQAHVDDITDEKWIDILFLMVSKQPPISADTSRGQAFALLSQVMGHVVAKLSHNLEFRDDLVDLFQQFASLAQDNLRQGRRGTVSSLFEQTMQSVTDLNNLITGGQWNGEVEFGAWASETLLAELERVGAAGAAWQNAKAVLQQQI